MRNRTVTVFGGSGFVGRHLVQRLAAEGATVRVAVRDVEGANYLRQMGEVGQVVPVATDIGDKTKLGVLVKGVDSVVNLVGLLYEGGKQNFERIHALGASNVAVAAAGAGVRHLVQLSAIGSNQNSPAEYARTKAVGENEVRNNFPNATILRPSVIFGPEDNLFNLFAGISRVSPVLPVFGCPLLPKFDFFSDGGAVHVDFFGNGGTKFQPVFVGDVAEAIVVALNGEHATGKVYELGGPRVYTSKELMELLLTTIRRRRLLVPVPFWYLTFIATFLELLPKPMITRDQVKLLQINNVVSSRAKKLKDLGIEPTAAESILPQYLARFRTTRNSA